MTAERYRELIRRILERSPPPWELRRQYFDAVKREPASLDYELHRILNRFFLSLDAYYPGLPPEQETEYEISDASFAEEGRVAIEALDHYIETRTRGTQA